MHKNWKPLISSLNAGTDPEELLNSLYYGIEIEFSDAGELATGSTECPYTEDDAISNLNDSASEVLANIFGEHGSEAYRIYREMLRHADLETIIDSCTSQCWSDVVQDELDRMCEGWEPDSDDDGEFRDVDGWNHGPDGTSGIVVEYRTDHPCGYEEMRERVNELFALAGDCEVPTSGSCHVHVSVPGVKHQTSGDDSLLHCCILFELSQLVGEFPACVHRRIKASDRYFMLDNNPRDKYSAVHFHSQGSIEFRLFGHCSDAEDALKCVRIAGIAFLRGYARYFAHAYEIKDVSEFRTMFAESIRTKTPLLSSVILPFMPMSDILSAACNETGGADEPWMIDVAGKYTSTAQVTIADEYRNPWHNPETEAEMLWGNPEQYLCELRNGQRLTLRRVEIEGTIAFVDSNANEGDSVNGYGPNIHGHRVWSSDDSPADIIRFRLQTVSGGVV